jgi:hypothetical protein
VISSGFDAPLRCRLANLLLIGGLAPMVLTAGALAPSSDQILAGIEGENSRRDAQLRGYSGARRYTLQNLRFGKQAAVSVLVNYRQFAGERYTVLVRSGSDRLNSIIDSVLISETGISASPVIARHEITALNYRVRLLGTEVAEGRNCYVLLLAPRTKDRFLIAGKAWVDAANYAVIRIEGQFAGSLSLLVGAPHIREDFVEVGGFWLPAHVRSVTTSFLLGPTELDILFSNYQIDQPLLPLQ